MQQVITISPHEYRETVEDEEVEDEAELNEMRNRAGLDLKTIYTDQDSELKEYKSMAGL